MKANIGNVGAVHFPPGRKFMWTSNHHSGFVNQHLTGMNVKTLTKNLIGYKTLKDEVSKSSQAFHLVLDWVDTTQFENSFYKEKN